MYDLVSIGSISVDLFFRGTSFTFADNRFQLALGGKYMADYLYEGVGGGGSNVAIGTSKLGLKSAVAGKIGENPFKQVILEDFQESSVSVELCEFDKDFMNISSILLTPAGEKTVIHFMPPQDKLAIFENDRAKLLDFKAVYLGNLPNIDLQYRMNLLHFLKDNAVLTILNLGSSDCKRPIDELKNLILGVDVLILNAHEFSDIIKIPYSEIDFNSNQVKKFEFLKDTLVVVTDSERGSYAYTEDENHRQESVTTAKIVDTSGCGDGYTAGFITQYLRNKDIKKSMEEGSKYAATILSKIGAN